MAMEQEDTKTRVRIYRQDLPAEWLLQHPDQRWKADIFPHMVDTHFHGTGKTKAVALWNASKAWLMYEIKIADEGKDPSPSVDVLHRIRDYVEPEIHEVRTFAHPHLRGTDDGE